MDEIERRMLVELLMSGGSPKFDNYEQPPRRAPQQTEGDNYGYASGVGMPYANPGNQAALGALQAAGGTAAYATAPLWAAAGPAGTIPMIGQAGAGLVTSFDGMDRFSRAMAQRRGQYPDQAELDAGMDAMRYYGHGNMRGPR